MELKPCPFCGGRAFIDIAHGGNLTYVGKDGQDIRTPALFNIVCGSCWARSYRYETWALAVKSWNRRTDDVVSD